MCQVVAIVFRISLSTYFLSLLLTLSAFLCFPLFNAKCITSFFYHTTSICLLFLSKKKIFQHWLHGILW
jgi:hypothetical protein